MVICSKLVTISVVYDHYLIQLRFIILQYLLIIELPKYLELEVNVCVGGGARGLGKWGLWSLTLTAIRPQIK